MINYKCYTDGAYSSSRNQGGIGIVFIRNGKKITEFSKAFKNTTNNQMEIMAALAVLKCIQSRISTLTIYTDSMYVVGCASMGWKRKKNTHLWKVFDEELERVSALCPAIKFQHVKGHADDKWNNYVDKLAVEASQIIL